MKRDFSQLRGSPFDALFVGGGIYGAWAAYDAALRGMRVALIDKGDWAGATSSASSKLVHGGLRYLEHGHLGLVRKTLDERRRLARLGPHRVRPLRFLFPAYRGDRVGRLRMRIGMWFYDRLAGRGQPVAPHRALGRDEMLRLAELVPDGLLGGFAFGDCGTDDARFTVEIVDGAHRAGAVTVNHAAATELVTEQGRVVGARVEDAESGEALVVRALATVCSAGPWVGALSASVDPSRRVPTRLTKGVHLVLPGRESEDALVISSNDDGRVVFLIPWYGRTILGTTDTDYAGDPGEVRVEPDDVAYLLERAGRVLRVPRWTEHDVVASYAGVRTLPATGDTHPSDVTREWSLVEPADGLLVSLGGKLTSARSDAATLVDRVVRAAGWPVRRSPTADLPFPWAPPAPFEGWLADAVRRAQQAGLDEETARNCACRYGRRLDRLLERVRDAPDLARRVVDDAAFCRAEIAHAVDDEMARTLEDVLRRRTPLLLLARVDADVLSDVAALAGEQLQWSVERREAERNGLMERYCPMDAAR